VSCPYVLQKIQPHVKLAIDPKIPGKPRDKLIKILPKNMPQIPGTPKTTGKIKYIIQVRVSIPAVPGPQRKEIIKE